MDGCEHAAHKEAVVQGLSGGTSRSCRLRLWIWIRCLERTKARLSNEALASHEELESLETANASVVESDSFFVSYRKRHGGDIGRMERPWDHAHACCTGGPCRGSCSRQVTLSKRDTSSSARRTGARLKGADPS